MLHKSYVC